MQPLNQEQILKILESKVDDSITSWDQIPHYSTMLNIDKAVARFIKAINNNERILMVHDSDADGLGTYMLSIVYFYGFLKYDNIEVIITDRSNGYGFVPKYINDRIGTDREPTLIITADNGITSIDACLRAEELSIDVIITDHHLVDSKRGLPHAIVVDPHQEGCPFEYKHINGTFVYWYFLWAVNDIAKTPCNMREEFLPELCLTTISDVMPLTGINRFIVKEGLKIFPTHPRQWVRTFYQYFDKPNVTAEDLSFNLIPSINVTSRLTNAEESAMFLTRESYVESMQWLSYIHTLNDTRKAKQEELMLTINGLYNSWIDQPFILVPGENFEKGILGPTAGRLAQAHHKPTIILSKNKAGTIYSGSGRSVGEVDLLGLVKDNPYVISDKVGGHKMACGVSLLVENLIPFWTQLQADTMALHPDMYIDTSIEPFGILNLRDIDWNLFIAMEQYQPFGQKFKKPTFYARGKFTKVNKMGKQKNHYSMQIVDGLGCEIRGVWFFYNGEIKSGKNYSFVFSIAHETFKPKTPEDITIRIEKLITDVEWSDLVDNTTTDIKK